MKSILILLLVFTIGFVHAGDDQRAAIIKVKLLNARLELIKAQGVVEASKTEAPEIVSVSYKKAVELKKAVADAQKAIDDVPSPASVLEKNQELLKEYEANRDILRKVEIDYYNTESLYKKKCSALAILKKDCSSSKEYLARGVDFYNKNKKIYDDYEKTLTPERKNLLLKPLFKLEEELEIKEKEYKAFSAEYDRVSDSIPMSKDGKSGQVTQKEYDKIMQPYKDKSLALCKTIWDLKDVIKRRKESPKEKIRLARMKKYADDLQKKVDGQKAQIEVLTKEVNELSKNLTISKSKYDAASKMVEGGRPETSIYKLRAKYDREIKPLRKKLWEAQKAYERFPNADRLIASTHSRLAREEKADSAELKAAKEKVAAYTKRVQELEAELAKIEGKPLKQTEQPAGVSKSENPVPKNSANLEPDDKPEVEITVNKKDTPEKPVKSEGDDDEF